MIPDYQILMRPVLEAAAGGEARISEVVDRMADKFALSAEERAEMLPSGKQTRIANRVHWAKSYLKQAGLVENTGRGRFVLTERGRAALGQGVAINNAYLEQYRDFQEFMQRGGGEVGGEPAVPATVGGGTIPVANTPDEALRNAHAAIMNALAADLLDRLRKAPPAFFESIIVELLVAMGYGGSSDEAGRALGRTGDDGVDGVIDQDPLGVDQIYIQAKRYMEGNNVSSGAIRDFYGGLSLKRAQKGIFVTTSTFTASAVQTARDLGSRIVLIDGNQFAKLMIRYNVGCRDEDVLHIKRIDEDFFER